MKVCDWGGVTESDYSGEERLSVASGRTLYAGESRAKNVSPVYRLHMGKRK